MTRTERLICAAAGIFILAEATMTMLNKHSIVVSTPASRIEDALLCVCVFLIVRIKSSARNGL